MSASRTPWSAVTMNVYMKKSTSMATNPEIKWSTHRIRHLIIIIRARRFLRVSEYLHRTSRLSLCSSCWKLCPHSYKNLEVNFHYRFRKLFLEFRHCLFLECDLKSLLFKWPLLLQIEELLCWRRLRNCVIRCPLNVQLRKHAYLKWSEGSGWLITNGGI